MVQVSLRQVQIDEDLNMQDKKLTGVEELGLSPPGTSDVTRKIWVDGSNNIKIASIAGATVSEYTLFDPALKLHADRIPTTLSLSNLNGIGLAEEAGFQLVVKTGGGGVVLTAPKSKLTVQKSTVGLGLTGNIQTINFSDDPSITEPTSNGLTTVDVPYNLLVNGAGITSGPVSVRSVQLGANLSGSYNTGTKTLTINATGGGGGSSSFTGLSDVPCSGYAGKKRQLVAINGAENALEFTNDIISYKGFNIVNLNGFSDPEAALTAIQAYVGDHSIGLFAQDGVVVDELRIGNGNTHFTSAGISAAASELTIHTERYGSFSAVETMSVSGSSLALTANSSDITLSAPFPKKVKVNNWNFTQLNSAINFPTSDGTNTQVLATNGAGQLYWRNISSSTTVNASAIEQSGANTNDILRWTGSGWNPTSSVFPSTANNVIGSSGINTTPASFSLKTTIAAAAAHGFMVASSTGVTSACYAFFANISEGTGLAVTGGARYGVTIDNNVKHPLVLVPKTSYSSSDAANAPVGTIIIANQSGTPRIWYKVSSAGSGTWYGLQADSIRANGDFV